MALDAALLADALAGDLDAFRQVQAGLSTLTAEERAALSDVVRHVPETPEPEPFRTFIEKVEPKYRFYRYAEVMIARLQQLADGALQNLFISMPPRHGKLCSDDTVVATTQGWKRHGDLRAGDEVFGPDGEPTRVIGVSPPGVADYEVELTNGAKIVTHGAHEWLVYDRARTGQPARIMETGEMALRVLWGGAKKKRCVLQLPEREALRFPARTDLVIDPYVLGVWLGDGSAAKPTFCYAPADRAVLEAVIARGETPSVIHVHKTTGVEYASFRGLKVRLRALGVLGNKHIPRRYLMGSVPQRVDLLAGLVDTDGHVERATGRVRIVTASPRLRDDLVELVRGLGWEPYVCVADPTTSSSGIVGRATVFTVGFQPDRPLPCALERKRCAVTAMRRRVGVKAVRRVAPKPGKCIQVARPDGLYLVGEHLTPTHNSLTMQLFVGYYLYRFPERWVGLASYNGDLAHFLARRARDYFVERGAAVYSSRDARSSRYWEQAGRGGLWVAGAGGSITGRGGNLLVLDDPLKNDEEAESEVIREGRNRWLDATWSTRGEPPRQKVYIQTRWHPRDPIGYTIQKAAADENAESWHYINFEAIRSNDPMEVPPKVTLEPDWREPGEALCPERFPLKSLLAIKASVGSHWWNALYQGRPTVREGRVLKAAWFETVGAVPQDVVMRVRGWDLAGTDVRGGKTETREPDYTVGVRMSRGRDGIFYIEHMHYGQWSPKLRNANMAQMAEKDALEFGGAREAVPIGFERESGIDAEPRTREIVAALAGYNVRKLPPHLKLEVRADGFVAQAEGKNVKLVRGEWNAKWLTDMCDWPQGKEDVMDATLHAFNMLVGELPAPDAVPETAPLATPVAYRD